MMSIHNVPEPPEHKGCFVIFLIMLLIALLIIFL
jgi:hypothetical protein